MVQSMWNISRERQKFFQKFISVNICSWNSITGARNELGVLLIELIARAIIKVSGCDQAYKNTKSSISPLLIMATLVG